MEEQYKELFLGRSIPEQRKLAKALGVEYRTPSITSQILGKGKVENKHRGRAKDDTPHLVIEEIHLANGKTIPGFIADTRIVRAAAQEMLRIADREGY